MCKFTTGTALAGDPFEGWGDVYFFCGSDYRYCRCDFTWNFDGWVKALVIWSFVVTACLGLQKLVIHAGLNGLLPGEEVVTKESLVSFCWRLIPYWLNSWEQQWGAECSSVMFELPHFALELLVVLPCVQIMSSRLKMLLMPAGRGLVPPFDQTPPEEAANMAPVIMTGLWEDRKADQGFQGRLRANFRVLALIVGISSLAAFNALYVPLHLERVVHTHPRSVGLLHAAKTTGWQLGVNSTLPDSICKTTELALNLEQYVSRGCEGERKLLGNLAKHTQEISRMQSSQYQDLTLCVEAALTIMRLSCEQYFTLISVFAAYLFFRQRPPPVARRVIWLNHRVSTIFKKAILYSFPAICWLYGAGLLFSSFASLVFWGQPAAKLWERLRTRFTRVVPVGLQAANEAQVEQMNGNCAVCWSSMSITSAQSSSSTPTIPEQAQAQTPGDAEEEQAQHQPLAMRPQGFMEVPVNLQSTQMVDPLAGAEEEEDEEALAADACKALPCGHAFHDSCIAKWLAQCHVQSRQPTCPMCNLVIKLEVSYQFSKFFSWPWARAQQPQQEAAAHTDEEESAEASQHQQQHIHPQQQHQHQTDSQTGGQHSHQLVASSSHAAADMSNADQQHQQSLETAWRHHSAESMGSLPQHQRLADDWYHVPTPSGADDYNAPTHSSLTPQLAQEKLDVSQQSHALRAFKPGHMRGFAASALLSQASSSSASGPATACLWGRDRAHVADSPVTGGQTRASPVLAGTTSEGTAHQVHVAEEQSQGCSQEAIAEQPQERRMLRRSFMPAALMQRMLGTPRRNCENSGLARVDSNNVGRMSARTDLADASAMPATN
ncbi:MAG: hypothetical protein FRX49_01996 [Trebouxia sp. A1-2]|nr:MAG: hypothetical protein FRX49_01996 [Trebouxia sp. A1-2]